MDAQDQKLQDFLAKRDGIMTRMAAEMSVADELKALAQPAIDKVLSVIDSLGIDEADKQKLRERILKQATSAAFSEEETAKSARQNVLNISSDYEYYLFVATAGLVLSVFGKEW